MNLEAVLADTLEKHRPVVERECGEFLNCFCGWNVEPKAAKPFAQQYRQHLASELAKACEGRQPLASWEHTPGGPILSIGELRVRSWLGSMYDDQAEKLAESINLALAAHSASSEPRRKGGELSGPDGGIGAFDEAAVSERLRGEADLLAKGDASAEALERCASEFDIIAALTPSDLASRDCAKHARTKAAAWRAARGERQP
jgi:hypothetical protein